MAKAMQTRTGLGALAIYAAIVVVAAFVFYEIGSGSFGYSSLTGALASASDERPAAAQRYGKILMRADIYGHCREFSIDNQTQQMVPTGTVVCDREQKERFHPRSRTEIIREAFSGQQPGGQQPGGR